MQQNRWLILTALTLEARAIADAFGVKPPDPGQAGILPVEGGAMLQIIGIRGKRIPANLLDPRPGKIVLAGMAGALDPALKIGDIVTGGGGSSTIHTAKKVIESAQEKARLFRETGAAAVDMETAIVKKIADEADVEMITIRAISDTADEAISPKMLDWINDFGEPRKLAVMAGLAANPGLVPQLARLGRNSAIACRRMADAVLKITRSATWPPSLS